MVPVSIGLESDVCRLGAQDASGWAGPFEILLPGLPGLVGALKLCFPPVPIIRWLSRVKLCLPAGGQGMAWCL